LNELLQRLRDGRRFLLVLHVRPDGDSIGSTLALARALRRMGKEAVVVRADAIPANLAFLAGAADACTPEQVEGEFDAAIFLDCAGLDRIGSAVEAVRRCRSILNVDHHPSNPRFGDVNVIDPEAAAVGEMTAEIIRGLGVGLDPEMAEALFTAVATDTGSFRFESTRPATYRLAAELCEHGARPSEVAARVWDNRPLAALRLIGLMLSGIRTGLGGAYAWAEVDREMLERAGAGEDEVEGLVNYPRSVAGVEVAALLAATTPGEVRVSLRSNRRVDVSRLAARFGGGGHARAAGCTLKGDLASARETLLRAVEEAL
jgi:phosphoesterase RecJ-like protein